MKNIFIAVIVIAIIVVGILLYKLFFKKGKGLSKNDKVDCSKKFLFVGDSLTALDQSYADQLKQVCPNISISKIAKVGEKTDWMLSQLQAELNSNKYDVISIWGGVNDIYATNSVSNAKGNLSQIYAMAKGSGAKVVALTVIPTATYTASTSQTTELTDDLNKWILSNNSLDAVIDANSILNDGNDGTKSEYLQADTLHINSTGHSFIMRDFVDKIINL